MNKDVTALIAFVLHAAEGQPIAQRIILYRGLAEICANEAEGKQLTKLANALRQSDSLCREFVFSFSQKTAE